MRRIVTLFAITAVIAGLSGCSYVFYPHADEFAEKAKGTTTIETLMNLTTMMDASAQGVKGREWLRSAAE